MNIGSVNYTTGEVRISNLLIDSYESKTVKIYAKTVTADIVAPPGKIILIKNEDIQLTVVGI